VKLLSYAVLAASLLAGAQAHAQQSQAEIAKEFLSTAGNPNGRWIEGETMEPHVAPGAHFERSMLYYPGTEELQDDEIRVSFMGSSYFPSKSQSGMSIFVELGNGDNFVFDMGIGSLRNYNSFSIPFASIDKIFITHLHMDHVSDLPYFTMFRPMLAGFTPLQVYGPAALNRNPGQPTTSTA
jgi:ribonuclease Z